MACVRRSTEAGEGDAGRGEEVAVDMGASAKEEEDEAADEEVEAEEEATEEEAAEVEKEEAAVAALLPLKSGAVEGEVLVEVCCAPPAASSVSLRLYSRRPAPTSSSTYFANSPASCCTALSGAKLAGKDASSARGAKASRCVAARNANAV